MSSIVTVNVRNVAVGGEGVGEVTSQSDGSNLLGITAFVPFAATGEVVDARVVESKKQYVRTTLVEVKECSPSRIQPECSYFMSCGGCELQHMSYDAQLEAKHEMIVGSLRVARFGLDVLERVAPLIRSEPYHYRRRVTLHVDSHGRVGFYRSQSRSVVPINTCSVAIKEIDEALTNAQEVARELQGKITSIQLEADEGGLIAIITSPYDLGSSEIKNILEVAKKYFPNVSLVAAEKEVGGFGRKILELPLTPNGSLSLRVPAGSFTQVNWAINLKLIEAVVRETGAYTGKTALDLYSGAGNFSLPLTRAGATVTAVESDPTLVTFGRENAERYNFLKRLSFVQSSVEKFLEKNKATFDIIVADPPRSGLGRVAEELPEAKKLVLISCHLPSFIRDVRLLLEEGWKLDTIQPFDMFAQTSYVEILSSFSKSS